MEIEVVRQVNSRWSDGRTFAAMPGRRVTVDDADVDAVAHMRHLIEVGDAVEVPARRPARKEPDPDMANKVSKPAEKSTTTTTAKVG